MHHLNAITVFLFVNSLKISICEVYTAIEDIAPLLETQRKLIDDVDLYILLEEKRLYLLKQQLLIYKRDYEKAMQDVPKYLGNPLNAYTLIKRLTTDLEFFHRNMYLGREHTKNYSLTHPGVIYPTNEDLTGAAQGLVRLKDIYNLEIKDLTEGVINGIEFSSPMLPSDCFVMGREMYNHNEHLDALPWFIEALNKFHEAPVDTMALTEVELMDYIAFTYYVLGDVEAAYNWTLAILEKEPNNERARHNIPYYEEELSKHGNNHTEYVKEVTEDSKYDNGNVADDRKGDDGNCNNQVSDDRKDDNGNVVIPDKYYVEKKKYEELCRGDVQVPIEVSSKLKCRYLTENHPFLILAPFKLEELYKDPDIYMYHDVLSDHEIEYIQEMAKPRFRRATIRDAKTGDMATALYRISKSAWLKDHESELVARVSRRVQDMTALEMSTAEELQVANYGIGGHYESHFDFTLNEEVERAGPLDGGNRIATVLIYMSDVSSGGATAFTALGVRVTPKKGTALFWMNLHPSGEGNLATRHAACPVLIGSKWVCTKWIHQAGQELTKPCNLQFQPQGFNRKLPEPVPITKL